MLRHCVFFSSSSAENLSDFDIWVGELYELEQHGTGSGSSCAHVTDALGLGERRTISCERPLFGNYVMISMNSTEPLTLCEVEVHRLKTPGTYSSSVRPPEFPPVLHTTKSLGHMTPNTLHGMLRVI